MIDFISVIKSCDKDKPNFGYCDLDAEYLSGWQHFYLEGCERLEIWWNPIARTIKLSGSLAYYLQGHNFCFSPSGLAEAVEHIQALLHVWLWDSCMKAFENGIIMPVEMPPKQYIRNHYAPKGSHLSLLENEKDKGRFRRWENKDVCLKMYDAKANILMKQGMLRREVLAAEGWIPDAYYLKFEARYLNPELLNNGRHISLEALANPNFQRELDKDLLVQYEKLQPMKTMLIPTDKKDLSTSGILLLKYAQDCINEGKPLPEVKKELFGFINQIPDETLSKADKDSRKRQLNGLFGKLEEAPGSCWDLSEKLKESLSGREVPAESSAASDAEGQPPVEV